MRLRSKYASAGGASEILRFMKLFILKILSSPTGPAISKRFLSDGKVTGYRHWFDHIAVFI